MLNTVATQAPQDSCERGRGLLWRFIRGQDSPVLTNLRPPGRNRPPGSVLVAAATALLFVLGIGLFGVSLAAQYRYVLAVKHQLAASMVEALALDLGMAIFSLLALGLARAGKPARTERLLIMACAAGSAVMNYAAANDLSPRSVLAYVMPPVFLAVVADRVVAVVRRHMLAGNEHSPWVPAGRAVLYLARLALAPVSTAAGLRRWLLGATPLPQARAAIPLVTPGATPARPAVTPGGYGPAVPRTGSKTARFLALVADRHGPLAAIELDGVSKICTALAPEAGLDTGAARAALRRAVLAARDGGTR